MGQPLNINKGIFASILAPIFIAISVVIVNRAGQYVHPLIIAAAGSLLSVVFLFPLYAFLKKPLHTKKLFTNLMSPFIKVVLGRAVVGTILIVLGFTLTTAVKAILLLRLEPLFVLLWSVILLKEKLNVKKFIMVLALLVGSILVVSPTSNISTPNVGDLLIVLALLSLSYAYIPTQKVVQEASPYGLNLYSNLIGGIIISFVAIPFISKTALVVSIEKAQFILGYVISFYVLAASLYFYAFKTVKPWIVASFLSLEVVVGIFIAVVLLGEPITIVQLAGSLIVVVATLLIPRYGKSG